MTLKTKKAKRYLNCQIEWDEKSVVKDAAGEMIIKGFANTASKDRVNDLILPQAFEKCLPAYMDNPVILFQHNWDKVIGKCIKADIIKTGEKQGLYIECKMSNAKDVEEVKTKIGEEILKTFSIGYNEIDAEYDEKNACNVIKELELLEISVVTIPCNAEAKFVVVSETKDEKSKDIDADFLKYLADNLKSLENNDDIDAEFLKELHDLFLTKQK